MIRQHQLCIREARLARHRQLAEEDLGLSCSLFLRRHLRDERFQLDVDGDTILARKCLASKKTATLQRLLGLMLSWFTKNAGRSLQT